jgi:hypothetical protein
MTKLKSRLSRPGWVSPGVTPAQRYPEFDRGVLLCVFLLRMPASDNAGRIGLLALCHRLAACVGRFLGAIAQSPRFLEAQYRLSLQVNSAQ